MFCSSIITIYLARSLRFFFHGLLIRLLDIIFDSPLPLHFIIFALFCEMVVINWLIYFLCQNVRTT